MPAGIAQNSGVHLDRLFGQPAMAIRPRRLERRRMSDFYKGYSDERLRKIGEDPPVNAPTKGKLSIFISLAAMLGGFERAINMSFGERVQFKTKGVSMIKRATEFIGLLFLFIRYGLFGRTSD